MSSLPACVPPKPPLPAHLSAALVRHSHLPGAGPLPRAHHVLRVGCLQVPARLHPRHRVQVDLQARKPPGEPLFRKRKLLMRPTRGALPLHPVRVARRLQVDGVQPLPEENGLVAGRRRVADGGTIRPSVNKSKPTARKMIKFCGRV